MSTETPSPSHPLRLKASVGVVLRGHGFALPSRLGAADMTIGLPELLVLAALSVAVPDPIEAVIDDVARRSGTSSDGVRAFIEHLQRRRRTIAAPVTRVPPAPLGDHPQRDVARDTFDDSSLVLVSTPLWARPIDGHFELVDHDGHRCALLDPVEFVALGAMVKTIAPAEAFELQRTASGPLALERERFAALIAELEVTGFIRRVTEGDTTAEQVRPDIWTEGRNEANVRAVFRRRAVEHEAAERQREANGQVRTKVVPVAFDPGPPLGLGLIVAYAKVYKEGALEEAYDFRLEWIWDEQRVPSYTERPAIYLFSNYLWSHKQCIEVSELVKRLSPGSITIHGGPDTPKYPGDVEAYFRAHPHVDITVRGEGEAATAEVLYALRNVIGDPEPDLSVLAEVCGISYRDGDRVVTTQEKDRIADLNIVPSPFTTGLFDAYAEVPGTKVTIETNRGCPYGCTFCDWGSATLSRIRKFDLDRVFAELDWCAKAKAFSVGPADANFGIFERDVEIAERIAELKGIHGYPQVFGVSYAKNTVKHLTHIIQTMARAGIVTQGILSLQSMDEDTLDAVHRSNIKTEKYDALAAEFRRSDLPLFVDLMLGLPGSTPASFRADLQQCVNREVQVRIPRTTLLVNSPMNDPEYRAEYKIETSTAPGPGKLPLVVSTSTFTRDDYREMSHLRLIFLLFENFGVLRKVARFVRQETGVPEVELYERIRVDASADPDRWPILHLAVTYVPGTMCAPVSWKLFIDELHDYLVTVIGVADDAALHAVLAAQHALLPSHGRPMPQVLELSHDVGAWYAAVLEIKESEHRDEWTSRAPRLNDFPPGQFVVNDPNQAVRRAIGCDIEMHGFGINWEYQSPVRRAFAAKEKPAVTPLPI